tara:strand:+ start:633 stop:1925 length:1293 start_codon:yes stop_codon:yes gene_type:complete
MRICSTDLPILKDIVKDIKAPRDNFHETNDFHDLKETIWIFIEDFINNNVELYKDKHFDELIRASVYESMYCCYYDIFNELELKIDIDNIIDELIQTYFIIHHNPRSYPNTFVHHKPDIERIDRLLEYFKTQEQPEQKTDAWYKFRYNGLTASTIYKAIDSQANINSIIYEKCQPVKIRSNSVNITSAFHNGHKYEPLSILLYENWFDTKVGEFGCMKHREHNFLRASPDGINIKRDSPLYGRALEIKNPVSRKLTGIPKKDYWVQMQMQMEVWDLDECDFLETTFQEYESEEEFLKDGELFNRTSRDKHKGVIVMFNDGQQPIYEYCPIEYNKEQFDKWYDEIMDKHSNHSWINNIYWYLKEYSLVLCPRNKKWFENALPQLQNVWNIILKERVSGHDHRKPKRKKKKSDPSPKQVLKIPTQSFDELVI